MAGLYPSIVYDDDEKPSAHLIRHQIKAVAAPQVPPDEHAQEQPARSGGSFADLECLLDQLASAPVFELGKPLPNEKYLPKHGLGSCPAAHNRALLDKDAD